MRIAIREMIHQQVLAQVLERHQCTVNDLPYAKCGCEPRDPLSTQKNQPGLLGIEARNHTKTQLHTRKWIKNILITLSIASILVGVMSAMAWMNYRDTHIPHPIKEIGSVFGIEVLK